MAATIVIFVIVLGLLVFVHEFGHFIVAKKSGMGVEEFGFGFPPRMAGVQNIGGKWRWVWGHRAPKPAVAVESDGEQKGDRTIYSINWIPLGGFVRITGENNEQENNPRSFINKPFWPRFLVLVAGVIMNVLLAWALITGGFIAGLPAAVSSQSDVPKNAKFFGEQIAILEVVKDLPANKAGLQVNDVILSVDGQNFSQVGEISGYIKSNAGRRFDFEIRRGKEIRHIFAESVANPPAGEGPTGIALAEVGKLKFPWYAAAWEGAKSTLEQVLNIYKGFGQLLTGKVGLGSLGGPVKIAKLTGQVAGMGFIYLVQFTAFLSLNLAVLNILPFPALDGGRVLFLIIEKIRGRRNNQKVEQWFNTAGFVLLIVLMIMVTVKDIIK